MKITENLFKNFLKCAYKAHLLLKDESGQKSDYEILQNELHGAYVQKVCGKGVDDGHIPKSVFLEGSSGFGRELLRDIQLNYDDISVLCDGIFKNISETQHTGFYYSPLIFSHKNKILKEDRYILAFRVWILEKMQNRRLEFGEIIYCNPCKRSKVKVGRYINEIGRLIGQLRGCLANPPKFILNEHCQICEFGERCREKAIKEENLSLLGAIGAREVLKKNKKGIFTLTQLSYTFRPRRRRKAAENYRRPHSVALRALAIRDVKVYVLGTPVVPQKQVEIFFDVEGSEESAFIYLASLVVLIDGKAEEHSFWANSPEDEVDVILKCLQILKRYDDYVLYHYGNYETSYLKRMKKKQGVSATDINTILSRSFNILAVFFDNVYMPTYTNGLKDIAQYLGFKWSDTNASGIQSIVWRARWEMTGAEKYRERLVQYNKEDCYALLKVKRFIDCMVVKVK